MQEPVRAHTAAGSRGVLAARLRAAAVLAALPFVIAGYGIVGRVCLVLLLPFPRTLRMTAMRLARHWGRALFALARGVGALRLEVEGEVPARAPFLVVANHQSLLDIPILFHVFARHLPRFVLKRELRWGLPNVSPATRAAGYAFVDRRPEAREDNLRTLERLATGLADDGAIGVIFPEGTWEPEGRPLPLKPAGLKAMLAAAPLDVLPVVSYGSWRVQRFRDLWVGLGDLRVRVRLGRVIPAAEARRDLDELVARLERHFADTVEEMRRGEDPRP